MPLSFASRLNDSPTALAALQVKADKAQPRDKCFLYAVLVSQMTDLAGRQFSAGDSEQSIQYDMRLGGKDQADLQIAGVPTGMPD